MTKKKNFLVYCGNPGLGKTFLCAALMEWAVKCFDSRRYHREEELFDRITGDMIQKGYDPYANIKQLIDDQLVFLDDVGKGKWSETREKYLFSIIDIRYNSMLPTVITSNLSIRQFRETYEERLCSRLFDKDNIVIELMDGKDNRKADA